MTRDQILDDWLAKARYARSLPDDKLWPAWSVGETLAVALILDDAERLRLLDYTREQVLDRLRYDIGQPDFRSPLSIEAAGAVFERLSAAVRTDG